MTARLFVIEGTAASFKSVGAKGFDGYVACLTERQKRELETLPSLPAASAVIKNACADWPAAHAQIADFVNRVG